MKIISGIVREETEWNLTEQNMMSCWRVRPQAD